jgi:hypothetical protein
VSVETLKEWCRQLFAFDAAQKQHILRAAAAKSYGLDPDKYTSPFPGSPQSYVVMVQDPSKTTDPSPPAERQAPRPVATGGPPVAPTVEPIRLKLAAWRLGPDGEWEVQGPDGSWRKVKDLAAGKGK